MSEQVIEGFDGPIRAVVQGASRGLGLAFVRQLLERSNVERILATCRAPTKADELQALADRCEGRLLVTKLDVTDEEEIAKAAAYAKDNLGHLDLLLNVAGILHDEGREMGPEKKLADVDPESALYSFQVNSLGPLLVSKHFVPLIRGPGRAVIANLSARVGSIGDNHLGGWYSYRASKAAQNMFTKTMAIELARYRKTAQTICVALHPGTVDTDLSKPFQGNVPRGKLFQDNQAANQLLDVIGGLTLENSGGFFDWAAETVPW